MASVIVEIKFVFSSFKIKLVPLNLFGLCSIGIRIELAHSMSSSGLREIKQTQSNPIKNSE